MNLTEIPLNPILDQEVLTTVEVNGENLPVALRLRYNTMAKCWFMGIAEQGSGKQLIDSLPLVTGKRPAQNILRQHGHLGLGSIMIMPATNAPPTENPDDENLGTEFKLVWGEG